MVFLMVPRYGARGAAWASTISYSLISFLMIGYFLVEHAAVVVRVVCVAAGGGEIAVGVGVEIEVSG
jgi:hypothetical protein